VKRLLVAASMLFPTMTLAQTPAPQNAEVYIIHPQEGQKIKGPFTVRFGLRGMGVTRAGDTTANVGHHHLLVDAEGELSRTDPIPTDRRHLHFGGGQTETQLDLPPGKHSLQLVLGDAEHKLFNPPVISKKITVTVLDPNAPEVKKNVVRKRTVRTKATQRRKSTRRNSR
jgi:Domain of unknown function (DUF4399)